MSGNEQQGKIIEGVVDARSSPATATASDPALFDAENKLQRCPTRILLAMAEASCPMTVAEIAAAARYGNRSAVSSVMPHLLAYGLEGEGLVRRTKDQRYEVASHGWQLLSDLMFADGQQLIQRGDEELVRLCLRYRGSYPAAAKKDDARTSPLIEGHVTACAGKLPWTASRRDPKVWTTKGKPTDLAAELLSLMNEDVLTENQIKARSAHKSDSQISTMLKHLIQAKLASRFDYGEAERRQRNKGKTGPLPRYYVRTLQGAEALGN